MISYWISLSIPKNKWIIYISKSLIIGSNSLLSLTLIFRWINEGYFPLSNLYESLIFLCWGISLIQLILESKTKSRVVGAILTPILFFICGFSSLTLPVEMQKALPLVPSLQSNWLMMHVSMMMISYAILIIGSLLSILYLTLSIFQKVKTEIVLTEGLEVKKLIPIQSNSKNSILETLDTWSYRVIGLGFPFLTIGIISGAVWANEAWGSYWSWDPKETWALITWITFAIYLHSRIIKGWEGRKAAVIGTIGFFVIWICYLGVNFLGKGLHSYGWMMS
jgi:cytochrome c-type biogenesis protein CcsB